MGIDPIRVPFYCDPGEKNITIGICFKRIYSFRIYSRGASGNKDQFYRDLFSRGEGEFYSISILLMEALLYKDKL